MADTLPKHYNLSFDETEGRFMLACFVYIKAVVASDLVGQLEGIAVIRALIYENPEETHKLNTFMRRFAILFYGPDKVDQADKDVEAEASAKGWKYCPDCGGYHA